MPKLAVLGNGPIAFTDQSGKMLLIPLSALTIDGNTIEASPPYDKDEIRQWLQYLVNIGSLTPGTAPSPKPAMVIQAADSGLAGNNIQVAFSNIVTDPTDPNKATFDATITETDLYQGLSIDSTSPSLIKTVLGTEKVTGTKPGLVHVLDADTPSLPKAGTYSLKGGSDSAKSTAKVSGDPSGTAFNVEAKKNGQDGDNTMVTVSNVDATAKTFTLTAVWTQSVKGIKLADLPGKLQGSSDPKKAYEIIVNKPNGGNFAIPAPGTIGLSGGADAREASTASGTAFTS
jgi:hypothetical protein